MTIVKLVGGLNYSCVRNWLHFIFLFFIVKSIIHPIWHNYKTIPSWDKVGIEFTGSQLDHNFFHPKLQSTNPRVFVDASNNFYQEYFFIEYYLFFKLNFLCCQDVSNTFMQTLGNSPQVMKMAHLNFDLMDLSLWNTRPGSLVDNRPSTD